MTRWGSKPRGTPPKAPTAFIKKGEHSEESFNKIKYRKRKGGSISLKNLKMSGGGGEYLGWEKRESHYELVHFTKKGGKKMNETVLNVKRLKKPAWGKKKT